MIHDIEDNRHIFIFSAASDRNTGLDAHTPPSRGDILMGCALQDGNDWPACDFDLKATCSP